MAALVTANEAVRGCAAPGASTEAVRAGSSSSFRPEARGVEAKGSSCSLRSPAALAREAAALLGFLGLYVALTGLSGIGCPIRFVTGVPCPGCGMTRAWLAALSGDLAAALAFHPLFWAVPVAFAAAFASRLSVWGARGRRFFTSCAAGLLVVVIAVWLWRLAVSGDVISAARPAWLRLLGI